MKWLHGEGESELREARALRAAHVAGDLDAYILDLGVYEIGNVLLRALRWSASDVADQLDDLRAIIGPPLLMATTWTRQAASLGETHGLSFYDACWAAAAQELQIPLVSADTRLQTASLAESPTVIASRLRLLPS